MQAVKTIRGVAMPLNSADVGTRSSRRSTVGRAHRLGRFLFDSWRKDESFVLNDPAFAKAVLVGGPNSLWLLREHAPWGPGDYGFKAIIALSFADIF